MLFREEFGAVYQSPHFQIWPQDFQGVVDAPSIIPRNGVRRGGGLWK